MAARARVPPRRRGGTAPSSASADEAVTVARGQLGSLEHALERDRRSSDQLSVRLASTERRAAVARGRGPRAGRAAGRDGAGPPPAADRGGRDRGRPRAGHRPARVGRGGPPPGRTGAPPVGGAGRRPRAGPRRGPGRGRGRAAARASTGWSGSSSTWWRSTRAGRMPSKRPPGPRWPPWSSPGACRPSRPWPGSAREGPPAPSWPSPTRLPRRRPRRRQRRERRRGPARDRVDPSPRPPPTRGPRSSRGSRRRSTPCWLGLPLRPGRVVRRHRSGPGPPRPGRGHPRRGPLLVRRVAGAGGRRGGHRGGGRRGPGPGRRRRPRPRPRPPTSGPRPASAVESTRAAATRGGPVRRPERGRPPDGAGRPPAGGRGPAGARPPSSRRSAGPRPSSTTGSPGTRPGRVELREQLPGLEAARTEAAGQGCRGPRGAQADRRAHRRGGLGSGANGRSARPAWSNGAGS